MDLGVPLLGPRLRRNRRGSQLCTTCSKACQTLTDAQRNARKSLQLSEVEAIRAAADRHGVMRIAEPVPQHVMARCRGTAGWGCDDRIWQPLYEMKHTHLVPAQLPAAALFRLKHGSGRKGSQDCPSILRRQRLRTSRSIADLLKFHYDSGASDGVSHYHNSN